jgi:hypothetical protein
MPCFSSARVIMPHDALRYCSRYLGNNVAKDDSSLRVPPRLCSGLKGSSFHLSISSVSHGLSFLYVDGIFAGRYRVRVWCCDREENRSPRQNYRKKARERESDRGSVPSNHVQARFHSRDHMRGACFALPCACLLAYSVLHTCAVPLLAAAASSLVYQPSDSTPHADMSTADRPRTFLDIDIDGEPAGRLVFELFTDKTPKTCEKYGIKWCTTRQGRDTDRSHVVSANFARRNTMAFLTPKAPCIGSSRNSWFKVAT